jgi:hypothetical protein
MNGKTVKVIETKERPAALQGYSMVTRGIRTKEAAAAWGGRYGFTLVYFLKAEEKVYGVQPIDEEAEALKQQSVQLLKKLEERA